MYIIHGGDYMYYKPLLIELAEDERYRKYFFKLDGEFYCEPLTYHFVTKDVFKPGQTKPTYIQDRLEVLNQLIYQEAMADDFIKNGFFEITPLSNRRYKVYIKYLENDELLETFSHGTGKGNHQYIRINKEFILNIFEDYVSKREEANELRPI